MRTVLTLLVSAWGLLAALTTMQAVAAPQTQLVSIPTRADKSIRAVRLKPDRRQALVEGSVILLPSGTGRLDISRRDDLLVRTRLAFARQGFDVLLPDLGPDSSRGKDAASSYRWSARHALELGALIAYMRNDTAPVFLVGNGNAALSVANAAARLRGERRPDAVVVTSGALLRITRRRPSVVGMVPGLQRITQPVLLVGHDTDTCGLTPPDGLVRFRRLLTGASHVDIRVLSGGKPGKGQPCSQATHHGFFGQDNEVVELVSDWLKALPKF